MVASVQVCVRVRPPQQKNQTVEDVCLCAVPQTKQVILGNQSSFAADYVFSPDYSQGYVYDACISQRINSLLEGSDISIIVFGKCNSGKTYSMIGPGSHCAVAESQNGIIPRATRHVFNTLSRHQQHNGIHYKVFISFFEVSNGEVHDLLSSSQQIKEFALATNEKGSTVIAGVENIPCQNVNEVYSCLRIGMCNRQPAWTNCNSSNSHCFFVFTIHQTWVVGGRIERRVSKGTFIDLASSETVVCVGPNGQLLHQNQSTNHGLRALLSTISPHSERWGNSQNNLSDPLLTTLLKDAFTISSHTLLMCCLSPSSLDYMDTLNHLRIVNQIRSTYGYHTDESGCDINAATSSQELLFENSENGSTQADSFGLEFAASQWLKLVTNAEGLFQKLVHTGLSKDAREQIQQWLCLKQECEECFGNDSTVSLQGKTTRSLERIDEVTESEEKSCSDKSDSGSELDSESIDEEDEDEEEEEDDETADSGCNRAGHTVHLRRQGFSEQLESLMKSFRNLTDLEVEKYIKPLDTGCTNRNSPPSHQTRTNGRRKSILPGDTLRISDRRRDISLPHPRKSGRLSSAPNDPIKDEETVYEEQELSLSSCSSIGQSKNSQKEAKSTPNASESKQNQIDMVILDLDGANKRIEELQQMIRIKEQFIEEMIENSCSKTPNVKARFQRKLSQLEEEYSKACANLSKAEKALGRGDKGAKSQVEKFKTLVSLLEKKLQDLEVIKQLAGDSAKKVEELESSLCSSKRKLQKLMKQLKEEESQKASLEKEHFEDQKRIRALGEKCKSQLLKSKNDAVDGDIFKWLIEEEKRLNSLRESSQRLKEKLATQQSMLEKREHFLKEKICHEKNVNKAILQLSTHTSNSDQAKDKSSHIDRSDEVETKESLRHEIRNLRKTRDCLVEQRRNLDVKINKDKVFSSVDERKFLECDEAIEAIDAAIEYKNELMCGRSGLENTSVEREKGEEMLMERLMKLSEPEMRSLLYKYFQKVIDLRESGCKMEQQISEQDQQIEAQTWKIQALSNALQQASIESERRLVMVHREHQEMLMCRHYAGDTTGGSSLDHGEHHQLLEPESMIYPAKGLQPKSQQTSNILSIPHQNLKKLQCSAIAHTTKVTRQKNKLIIQQQKSKHHSK